MVKITKVDFLLILSSRGGGLGLEAALLYVYMAQDPRLMRSHHSWSYPLI